MFPAPFWASPSFHMLCPFNLMTSCKTPMRTPFGSNWRRRCDVLTSHESTHLCAWWTCTCVGLANLKWSRTVKIYSYQDVCKQQAAQQVVHRMKNEALKQLSQKRILAEKDKDQTWISLKESKQSNKWTHCIGISSDSTLIIWPNVLDLFRYTRTAAGEVSSIIFAPQMAATRSAPTSYQVELQPL